MAPRHIGGNMWELFKDEYVRDMDDPNKKVKGPVAGARVEELLDETEKGGAKERLFRVQGRPDQPIVSARGPDFPSVVEKIDAEP